MAITYAQGAGGVIFNTGTGGSGEVVTTNSSGWGGSTNDIQIVMFAMTDNATMSVGSSGYTIAASAVAGDVTAYLLTRSPGGAGAVNLAVTASGRWYAVGSEVTVSGSSGVVRAATISAYSTATALAASSVAAGGLSEALVFGAGGWFAVNDPTPVPTIGSPTPDTPWTVHASSSGWMDQVQAPALGSGRSLVWSASPVDPTGTVTATASAATKGFAAMVVVGGLDGHWCVGRIGT